MENWILSFYQIKCLVSSAYPQLSTSCFISIFISLGMESTLQDSANMPPAAAAADLGLSYHAFFNDAEPQ